jgi:diguanylate cyclase (GGDEF)-like protein
LVRRRHDELKAAVSQAALLPTTLAVPVRLLELHRSGRASMEQYAAVLWADPTLSARVVALANSAAFKPRAPVTGISHALVMIGVKNLMPLVFGVSLAGLFNRFALPAEERSALWRGALLKGIAAREAALTFAPPLAEQAMLGGLLQDLAVPVMRASDLSLWPELWATLDGSDRAQRLPREERMYGTTHAAVGAELVAQMKLPALYRGATAEHHAGHEALAEAVGDGGLARALAYAAELPHRVTKDTSGLKAAATAASAVFCAGGGPAATPADAARVWKATVGAFGNMIAQLGDPDERSGTFREFMQALCGEVAVTLEAAIGHSTEVISTLQDREARLQQNVEELQQHQGNQTDVDALTQVFDRRGFLTRGAKLAATAVECKAGCVVGYVGIADLDRLNAEHGHDAGDQRLKQVARRLLALVRTRGVVGRMAGGAFAFVAADADRGALAGVAKAVAQALGLMEAQVAGRPVALACRIGVVDVSGEPTPAELERHVRDAEERAAAAAAAAA